MAKTTYVYRARFIIKLQELLLQKYLVAQISKKIISFLYLRV